MALAGSQFGVTFASTFKTPSHINADSAYSSARYLASKALRTRYADTVIAAMAYAWLRAIGSRKHRRALAWGGSAPTRCT